jgi:hypothetical protein
MRIATCLIASLCLCGPVLLPVSTMARPGDLDRAPSQRFHLAQQRPATPGWCKQRAGPFPTEHAARKQFHDVAAKGVIVSHEDYIFSCYDQYGNRRSCFYILVKC